MRFSILLSVPLACAVTAQAAATCESLAGLALPSTTITIAQSTPAGSFTPPGGRPISNVRAFCRVAGSIKPSADSDIEFEVWMPSSGWNGKFQGIGNGGYAGSINFNGLANAVGHGYATAATDTGHRAGGTDAAWAAGHLEKIVDFGYRAIHETAEEAKALIAAFYGERPRRAYFNSCSNGGRQALMEAQRFAADYDGIVAGAPANYWTHLLVTSAWDLQTMTADPAGYIPAAKLPAIEAASVTACDSIDGVKDGVLEDPTQCRYDPSVLLCQGAESDGCLTAPQVAALKKLYAGPKNSKGAPIFPGHLPGAESGPSGWAAWVTGPEPTKGVGFAFGSQFLMNMVYGNPAWDYRTMQAERDAKAADEKLARILNATDPDLRRFRERGGKLILYHGWNDPAISALNTIDYYKSVVSKTKDAASFVRLFMAPGMQHCSAGPGPDSFGQGGVAEGDAEHDVTSALEHWVDYGAAPARIIATKYKTGTNPASGVVRTRPLCPYPQIAKWNGSGSTDDAANFVCADPGGARVK